MERLYMNDEGVLTMQDSRVFEMLEELTYKVYRLEDECAVAHAKITELEEEREDGEFRRIQLKRKDR